MTEEQETAIGQKLIDILGFKVGRDGRVMTSWGTKTPLGLYKTIKRIIEECAEGQSDDVQS